MASNDSFHLKALNNLCRVCGNKLKKQKKQKTSFQKLIQECFAYDVVGEDPNVFPCWFCHNCHTKMKNIRKGRKSDLHLAKWYSHSINCKSCLMYEKIQKGGRMANKSWRPGRPKSFENFSNPIPDAVRKVIGHLVSNVVNQAASNILSFSSSSLSRTRVRTYFFLNNSLIKKSSNQSNIKLTFF